MLSAPVGQRVVLCICVAGIFLPFGVSIPALSASGGDGYALTAIELGTLLGVDAVTSVVSRAWTSVLLGRVPFRLLLLMAALIVSCGVVAMAVTPSFPVMMAARMLAGAGEGIALGIGSVWLVSIPTRHERIGAALSGVGALSYGSLAAGAAGGTAMLSVFSPRVLLALTALLPLLVVAILLVPEPKAIGRVARGSEHSSGLLRATAGPGMILALCGIMYALITSQTIPLAELRGVAAPSIAISAFGAVMVGMRLLVGNWVDPRAGRSLSMTLCAVLATGGAIVASAGDAAVFALGGAVVAVGLSLVFPMLNIVAINAHPSQRTGIVAIFGIYMVLGQGIGTIVLGLVRDLVSVEAAFATAIGCAMAASVLSALLPKPQALPVAGRRP